jgi:hypothetical protein
VCGDISTRLSTSTARIPDEFAYLPDVLSEAKVQEAIDFAKVADNAN